MRKRNPPAWTTSRSPWVKDDAFHSIMDRHILDVAELLENDPEYDGIGSYGPVLVRKLSDALMFHFVVH